MIHKFLRGLILLLTQGIYAQTTLKTDSLQQLLNNTSAFERKVILCMQLSEAYEVNDLDQALKYAQKAVWYAHKVGSPFSQAEAYNHLANIFEYRSEPDSSFIYHKKALKIRLKQKDNIKIGDSYNNIAIYYDKIGNYPLSLSHYFKALKYYDTEKNIEKQGMVFSNIGIVYKAQKDYTKALNYYTKALKAYKSLEHDFGIAVNQGNIGGVLLLMGRYKESIAYSEQAKENYAKIGYERLETYPLSNIAIALDSLKDYDQAEKLYLSTIKAFEKFGNSYEVANTINAYVHCLIKQHKHDKIDQWLNKALSYAQQSKAYALEVGIRKNMAQNHYLKGEYQQAYVQMQAYALGKDSLFEDEKTKVIFELDKQYQTEKSHREILEQRTIIAEKNLKIGRQNIQILLILSLLACSILIGYIFFYKQKQHTKRKEREILLKEAYQKIDTQNQLHKQKLLISRDLHDNIGSQLTFVISSLENIKYYLKDSNKEVSERINSIVLFTKQTISALRDTIWAMNKGEICFEDLLVRLHEFIDRASYSVEQVCFDFSVSQELKDSKHKITSLEGINLYRIIQESVNNAIKYADAQNISVSITPSDSPEHRFKILVVDNGKGFSVSENSSGNGIINIRRRAEEISGVLSIVSDSKGTCITVLL